MEDLTLTISEVVPEVTTATYRLVGLGLDWERALIVIRLRGANGETKEFRYGGNDPSVTPAERETALALMTALNTANLPVKSLQRRVLERLIADGKISGSVTGSPD